MLTENEERRYCLHQILDGVHGVIPTGDAWRVATFDRAGPEPRDQRDRVWLGQTMRRLGFRRRQRRLDGRRQHAYVRPALDPRDPEPRIVIRPDPDGVPRPVMTRPEPRDQHDRQPSAPVPPDLSDDILITSCHARYVLAQALGREPTNAELGATMHAAGFRPARRRFNGVRHRCYAYRPAGPTSNPGLSAELEPPGLRGQHGAVSARDARRALHHDPSPVSLDRIMRAYGWRRCRARLDGRRQTVYVRPAAGDEHVWPSALPRVRP